MDRRSRQCECTTKSNLGWLTTWTWFWSILTVLSGLGITSRLESPHPVGRLTMSTTSSVSVFPQVPLSAGQGQWIVKVLHRGGTTQDFGLVLSALATPTPQADLVVFDGSIVPSSVNPLRNDLIAISIAWMNQGTSPVWRFRCTL